ncbi:Gamma interferon inducible lysosomal thiol reductase GILT [Trema orientale]|uniref:Gamma interferon inducible lysosomal thiol reductase GILT n=1 Tax=Trema orientale TaxID=63057 RepID=A0A2P5F954_TREOI|nr:Gamma interferon inducible lysosomal thiol reductase GILT [Trema orientale]
MVSHPSLVFTFAIGFSLLLFTFQCHTEAYDLDNGIFDHNVSKMVSQKVNLSVYYEALNPTCASFIVKNLARIFDNGLNTILNLRLVPWGNAYLNKSNNAVVCQNGSDECKLNTLQACTINVLHDVNKHFALIYCFEFLAIEGRYKDWRSCFSSLGLPPKPVLDCFNSLNGTKLEQKYAIETAQLNPPHTFVPWVVVNNQPIGNDYKNFTTYACKAYKGTLVPMACH